MLKICFDIGGVLSKYPDRLRELCKTLSQSSQIELYVITDMHDHREVVELLQNNGFTMIPPEHVYTSDYATYGEACKAKLLKELKIDIFLDDFAGYLCWDSQLGEAPIRLMVCPDMFQPYWHDSWKVPDNYDFGRRRSPPSIL